MVVKSGVADDARIRRIAGAVAASGRDVTVIGDRPGPDDAIPGVNVVFARGPRARGSVAFRDPMRRSARWLALPDHRRRDDDAFARAVAQIAPSHPADLVHAHDLSGLRAAQPMITDGTTLIYDAHECWNGRKLEGRPTPLRRRRDLREEAELGRRAQAVITVSAPLARWFEDRYGWPAVDVVRNTFRAVHESGTEPSPQAILYAGLVDFKRDLETLVEGVRANGDVGLVVRGNGDAAAIDWLRRMDVDVRHPVKVDELSEEYRRCGLGVVTLSDNSVNHRVALPNKLFQAVQSGVPIVASDLPAIRELVDTYDVGACFTPGDAGSFAAAVSEVVENYAHHRKMVIAAQPALSWEEDERELLSIYDRLDP